MIVTFALWRLQQVIGGVLYLVVLLRYRTFIPLTDLLQRGGRADRSDRPAVARLRRALARAELARYTPAH